MGRFVVRETWGGRGYSKTIEESGPKKVKEQIPIETKKLVWEIQHGKSLIVPSLPIERFHHEPARMDLNEAGWEHPNDVRVILGVARCVEAAFHDIRSRLFGKPGDLLALDSILGQMNKNEMDKYSEIICGDEKYEVERIILERRKIILGL